MSLADRRRPRIAVLMGGPDAEHEVSLWSGGQVARALREQGRFEVLEVVVDRPQDSEIHALDADAIFPVLHGPYGEGGPLQEILEAAGVPYVGSGPEASRAGMDKLSSKAIAAAAGVPTPEAERLVAGVPMRLEGEVVIKPIDEGSSVGVRLCRTAAEVAAARRELEPRHPRLMAERWIRGRELTVGLVDGHPLPIIEIVPATGFYGYEEKYLRDDTRYLLEPTLPEGVADACRRCAAMVWTAIGCRDLARVDFLLDSRGPWFLEVNTMPGMTDHSLVPMAAARAGLSMAALCEGLVERALARHGASREGHPVPATP